MNSCVRAYSSYWLLIGLFLLSKTIVAQSDYSLKTFTKSEGLSNNWVQSICEDNTGYLWIATWDGLSRFDGYEFKEFDCNPEDSLSIPYFSLDKVVVDRFGNVLVMAMGKPLSCYNKTLDRFEKFKINGRIIRANDVRIDNLSNTWIVGPDSLFLSSGADNSFKSIEVIDANNNPLPLSYTKFLSVDNTGIAWLYTMTPEGISIWKGTKTGNSVIKFAPLNQLSLKGYKSYPLHNFDVLEFYVSKSGKLWLFSKYGLFIYNKDRNQFQPYTSKVQPEEFSGQPYFTWIDETTGINIINTKANSYCSIKSDPGKYFETAFVDRHNTIWTGNISSSKDNIGLGRYTQVPGYFKHYLSGKNEKNESYDVGSILKDRFGDVWAGLNNSSYSVRIKPNGEFKKFNFPQPSGQNGFSLPKSIAGDSMGIWFGLTNSQLIYYAYQSGKFNSVLPSPLIVDKKTCTLGIHNIIKRNDEILINGYEGVYKYNLNDHKLTLEYKYYSGGIGFTMSSDQQNGLWVGLNSATLFHLNSKLIQDWSIRIRERQDIIEQICIGDNDDLWLALQGGGLGHLIKKDGSIKILTTKEGLINNTLHSIVKDKKGNLWITSDKGFSKFNPKSSEFINFGSEDGLKIQEFNDDSYFLSPDGEIFFGGVGGLVGFNPDKMDDVETDHWPLVITDLIVSGIPRTFAKSHTKMDTLVLKKGDNNFNISFASLNLKDYLRVKYRYRLLGVSDLWKTVDQKNRSLAYFNLHPGKYKLEIESANRNGKWNSKTSLLIFIPFRIYEYLWFKIILGLLILTSILSWIYIYIKGIRIMAKKEQEELRMQVLRSQMNPHFIFNSLNSINYFISNNDKFSANRYIADFSRLIRFFLSNISDDFVSLESELQLLSDYLNLEHLRFGDKFNYTFDVSAIDGTNDRFILAGIIQPFIENAIWHGMNGIEGRKGQLNIYFQLLSSTLLQCVIEDDGIGRKLAGQYRSKLGYKKSRGIGIVQERLNFYNVHFKGNFQVNITDLYTDREETGTRVVIDLPLKKWIPKN